MIVDRCGEGSGVRFTLAEKTPLAVKRIKPDKVPVVIFWFCFDRYKRPPMLPSPLFSTIVPWC